MSWGEDGKEYSRLQRPLSRCNHDYEQETQDETGHGTLGEPAEPCKPHTGSGPGERCISGPTESQDIAGLPSNLVGVRGDRSRTGPGAPGGLEPCRCHPIHDECETAPESPDSSPPSHARPAHTEPRTPTARNPPNATEPTALPRRSAPSPVPGHGSLHLAIQPAHDRVVPLRQFL